MKYTNQEAFDLVARGLLKQGMASHYPGTQICLYRGPAGRKCAAGFLIPDDHPATNSQGDWEDVIYHHPDLAETADVALVMALQAAHDKTLRESGLASWKDGMRVIAHNNGLSAEVLDAHVD